MACDKCKDKDEVELKVIGSASTESKPLTHYMCSNCGRSLAYIKYGEVKQYLYGAY